MKQWQIGVAVTVALGALAAVALLWTMSRRLDVIQGELGRVEEQLQKNTEATAAARQQASAERERAEAAEERASLARRQRDEAVELAGATQTRLDQIQQERAEEMDRLEDTLGRVVNTRRTALGVIMNLDEDFLQFDFDKAELRPRNRELLSRIAGILLTSSSFRIAVFGHTDDVGTEEYNQQLSLRRAEAVRDYLVEAGIDKDIISTEGFGKSRPLVEGGTRAARAKNRRVEIGIIDALVKYEKVEEQP